MAEFEVGGVPYRSTIMDGETQAMLIKILAPLVTSMIGLRDLPKFDGDEAAIGEAAAQTAPVVMPIAKELQAMPRDDFSFVMNACLSATQVNREGRWWPVRTASGVVSNRDDGVFRVRMAVMWNTLRENLAHMFSELGIDIEAFRKLGRHPGAGNA